MSTSKGWLEEEGWKHHPRSFKAVFFVLLLSCSSTHMAAAVGVRGIEWNTGKRGGKWMWCSAWGMQRGSLCLASGRKGGCQRSCHPEREGDWFLWMLRAFNSRGSSTGGDGAKYSNCMMCVWCSFLSSLSNCIAVAGALAICCFTWFCAPWNGFVLLWMTDDGLWANHWSSQHPTKSWVRSIGDVAVKHLEKFLFGGVCFWNRMKC